MNRFLRAWVVVCAAALWVHAARAGIYSNDFSSGVGAGVISGNAAIVSSRLKLTPNSFGTYGTLLLNDLDPGRKVQSFTATFNLIIDGHGVADTADGLSLNFANPATYPGGYQYYELGAGTNGLQARFQTYVSRYTALGVNGIGPQVAYYTTNMTDGSTQPVTITYHKKTGATLTFRTNTLSIAATQLTALGFSGPLPGFRFLFGARCGSVAEDHIIDDLVVTTVPAGTNASLTNLTLSAGTLWPVFASASTNYLATVPNSFSNLTVTPFAADTNATIVVNGATNASGAASGAITLNSGTNLITVAVTAEDETAVRNYTITIVRPTVYYVAPGSPSPAAPYATWQTAAHTIQEAIDVAVAGAQVLVSNGTYSTGGRVVHEALTNRVAITNTITVQSVNGPDVTTIEGFNTLGEEAVRCVYVGTNATLSGFTLMNGATRYNGSLSTEQNGGGAWCESSGVMSNCVMYNNRALNVGGGVRGGTLYNCVLVNNLAAGGGGAYLATLNDCIVADNQATSAGGGIWNCTLNRCEVRGNLANGNGGGAFSDSPGASILNSCVIRNNFTAISGGGAYASVLNNCVVAANSSPNGGGVDNCTLNNSIVLNNGGNPGVENHNGTSAFAYSCTTPDPGGTGNITGDPLFVAPFDSPPNFHLAAGSPCLDSGNNATVVGSKDLDRRSRIANGTVDMGAFEVQATMLVLGTNGAIIANGDASPAAADGTDFGLAPAPTGTVVRVFAITNSGDFDLNITGVTVSGLSAGEFTVLSYPGTVNPGAQTNLVVRMAPVSGGSKPATIIISGNDPANPEYSFSVQGSSDLPAPVIRVLGINGVVITNGDTTASAADGTDFGITLASSGLVTRTFAITNAGSGTLVIGGVSTSGASAVDFSVLSYPTNVSAGSQSNLVVRFSPATAGSKAAVITLINNDLTSFNYAFAISGSGYVAQTRYVWTNSPAPAAPYLSWSNAARTIQDALDASLDTDLILVTNGVYATGGRVVHGAMTNRVAITKAVTVRSVNGPSVTTIQGLGPVSDAAVRCAYVGTNAVLSGFTLTNGATRAFGDQATEQNGGSAWCETSGILSNCVIVGGIAPNVAGGVSGGTLNRCVLANNQAYGGGGAYSATLNNCLLYGNSAFGNNGGAVWGCALNNCTLAGNTAASVGGAAYLSSLSNCIAYFNSAPTSPNISGGTATYTCTTPNPGGTGNITNQPLFVATNDYHLNVNSPCIDAGNNAGVIGTNDLDGNPRIVGAAVDMGAYETLVPDISVRGINNATITNGAASPNLADGSDFNWCYVTTQTVTRTFTITNAGTAALTISGITTNGTGAADFTVLSFPSVIPAGSRSNLVIQFDPPVIGIRTAVVAIANNGRSAVSNYTFTVQGGGNMPATRYVATNSPNAAAPFTNWHTAARTIQDAVDWTFSGDHVVVTDGVYAAGGRATPNLPQTNRVVITNAITVESVNGPAVTIIQGAKDPLLTNGPAAVRCVYFNSAGAANLSGFTIMGGGSSTSSAGNASFGGGALFISSLSAVMTNCIITGNSSPIAGGGVLGGTLFNCTISSNNVMPFGSGGGAYDSKLNNCTITGNRAYEGGGTYYGISSNSLIMSNVASVFGGGAAYGSHNNSLIIGNFAPYGGGMNRSVANNCTVAGNHATYYGGGVYDGTYLNSILYFNTAGIDNPNHWTQSSITIAYCCTTPNPGGSGNFTNAPLFVATNDYHLTAGSPCRDAGLNAYAPGTTDLDGSNRIVNLGVDIGAYEFQGGTSVDYDNDGMPSWWEALYGVPVANAANATTSSDGDWMTDLEEYIADTQPTNGASYFPPALVTNAPAGQMSLIIAPTSTGRVYGVYANTNLLRAPQLWTLVPPEQTGTAASLTLTITNSVPAANYRIGVRLP